MHSGIYFCQVGTFGWLHWQQAIALTALTCLQTMAVAAEVEVDEAVTLVVEVVAVGVTLEAEVVVAVEVTLVDEAVAVAVGVTLAAVGVAVGVTLAAEAVAVVVAGTLVVAVVVEEGEVEVGVAEAPWSLRLPRLLYPLQVWHLLSQHVSV